MSWKVTGSDHLPSSLSPFAAPFIPQPVGSSFARQYTIEENCLPRALLHAIEGLSDKNAGASAKMQTPLVLRTVQNDGPSLRRRPPSLQRGLSPNGQLVGHVLHASNHSSISSSNSSSPNESLGDASVHSPNVSVELQDVFSGGSVQSAQMYSLSAEMQMKRWAEDVMHSFEMGNPQKTLREVAQHYWKQMRPELAFGKLVQPISMAPGFLTQTICDQIRVREMSASEFDDLWDEISLYEYVASPWIERLQKELQKPDASMNSEDAIFAILNRMRVTKSGQEFVCFKESHVQNQIQNLLKDVVKEWSMIR